MATKTRRAVVLRRTLTAALAAAALSSATPAAAQSSAVGAGAGGAALTFRLVPLQGALVGSRNPSLRDQAAGALPWVIRTGRGTLHANGKLELQVRGLVLADDPAVPPAHRLMNPIPTFRAVVSCVRADGTAVTSETPPVSAGTDGDARIDAFVEPPLPKPCVAPIVFVGNGAQHGQDVAWFAVTGVN